MDNQQNKCERMMSDNERHEIDFMNNYGNATWWQKGCACLSVWHTHIVFKSWSISLAHPPKGSFVQCLFLGHCIVFRVCTSFRQSVCSVCRCSLLGFVERCVCVCSEMCIPKKSSYSVDIGSKRNWSPFQLPRAFQTDTIKEIPMSREAKSDQSSGS